MKVLIAYDGSPQSNIALEDLRRAGLPAYVDAVVLTVADARILSKSSNEPFLSRSKTQLSAIEASTSALFLMEEASAIVDAGCRRLQMAFPSWNVQAQVSVGLPAWAIFRKSEEQHADLVVVGADARSHLDHFLLGRVSHTLLTQLFCSVRVGRNQAADSQQPLRLLIGIDGTWGAENAAKVVAQRVWPSHTEVRLVMAIEPLRFSNHASTLVRQSTATKEQIKRNQLHVERVMRVTAEMIARHNPALTMSISVKAGDPKAVLLEEAERWRADCIFLGARGHSWSVQQLLGHVASAVATHANCSVEIVRNRRQNTSSTMAADLYHTQ
jgi:nucleotide-binding universal stress UspA family protein